MVRVRAAACIVTAGAWSVGLSCAATSVVAGAGVGRATAGSGDVDGSFTYGRHDYIDRTGCCGSLARLSSLEQPVITAPIKARAITERKFLICFIASFCLMGSLLFYILMQRVVLRLDTASQQLCIVVQHYHLQGWLLVMFSLHTFV